MQSEWQASEKYLSTSARAFRGAAPVSREEGTFEFERHMQVHSYQLYDDCLKKAVKK